MEHEIHQMKRWRLHVKSCSCDGRFLDSENRVASDVCSSYDCRPIVSHGSLAVDQIVCRPRHQQFGCIRKTARIQLNFGVSYRGNQIRLTLFKLKNHTHSWLPMTSKIVSFSIRQLKL